MINIVVALITGFCSVLAVVLTNMSSNRKVETTLDKQQAVTDEKIVELTREVREHNNFARRMPVVEEKLDNLEKRVSKLEK